MSWTLTVRLMLSAALAQQAHSQSNVTITTKKGSIVGLRFDPNPTTRASYDAFIGIPYGDIPARFQLAVPPSSWTSPLFTQTDSPVCPQPNMVFSENCLYLNVFTPVNAASSSIKFPVIAYIHGGGYTKGSSSTKKFGPDFLVPAGVILITMNYRLGAAGFLTLGSKVAPGNLGLYDTQLVLQWIQDEISMFGGDPTRVTLMGHSSGSVMTHFHYLSPVSSGLFRGAIAQSGSALSKGAYVTKAEGVLRAKLLAKGVGCDTTLNDTLLLACLQNVSMKDIVANQSIQISILEQTVGNFIPFRPVLDTEFLEKPFFNDTITNLITKATNRAKPLIAGFTTEEGIIMFSNNVWTLAEVNLAAFIPENMSSLSDDKKAALVNSLRSRYFPDLVDENKVLDIVRLYTDYCLAYPTIEIIRHFANWTYGYLFSYEGSWAPIPSYFTRFQVNGVGHGAELYYLFYSSNRTSQDMGTCLSNSPNLKMRDIMVQRWTTFAKTGAPGGSWERVSNGGYMVIDINSSMTNSSTFENKYYNFWATMQQDTSSATNSRLNILIVLVTLWCMVSLR